MASIKDAFQESYQDRNAILKFVIFAIPLYYCVNLFIENSPNFLAAAIITYLILFGFLIKCTSNVRNGKDYVLPSFNIFDLCWSAIKATVALGPSIVINCWLANFLCSFIQNYVPESNVLLIFKYIIWGIFISIILSGYLCYAKSFKIADAYNLKIISDSSVDIMIAILFMIPQIILADVILVTPPTYIIWLFFGIPSPVAIFFWCTVAILNLAMMGHYLAQIDYEIIKDDD